MTNSDRQCHTALLQETNMRKQTPTQKAMKLLHCAGRTSTQSAERRVIKLVTHCGMEI